MSGDFLARAPPFGHALAANPCPKVRSRLDLETFLDETVVPIPLFDMDATTALAIYRAEKDKALRERRVSHVQLMAEAQEAFRKMLADAQLARKGGRPKGSTSAPAPSANAAAAPTPAGAKVAAKTKAAPSAKPAAVAKTAAQAGARRRPPAKSAKPSKAVKVSKAASSSRKVTKAISPKRIGAKRARSARGAVRVTQAKSSAKQAAPHRKQAASRERRSRGRSR